MMIGFPAGALLNPSTRNSPSWMFSIASSFSPWKIRTSTEVWSSTTVKKTSLLRTGIAVFLAMIGT